ncbi:hypothetical protein PMG11_02805 [Penicillium brasilianum]|uniref:PEBP-like protein n=1 Tax=Penicillium brasilianum TaxID=104259 RepID=A0A0F7TIR4_PENBI|nr:hypothetical protein PMG11_02805 [Penicillium brasilianum]
MNYIEYGISRIFASAKGRDARLFTKGPAFTQIPGPTFSLKCTEVGPSGSRMPIDLSAEGLGRFPTLSWSAATPDIKEYLLVSEDPDAPLPSPIIHGIYYGIPASKMGVSDVDFEVAEGEYMLKGGFKYGKNRRGTVYIPPRPLLGHGPHRYFFTLVALSQPVDTSKMSPLPTIEEMAKEIEGKVMGWGEWVGSYERKWE